jgi:hypothetical protein
MSHPKEAQKFHEAERHSTVLSHSDFAKEQEFDYLTETEALNDFLLSKNWDSYFVKQKSGYVICDVVILNNIFLECLKNFSSCMDSVQIFHIITDFYNIDAKQVFDKLLKLHRERLVSDLEYRIGKLRPASTKAIGKDRIQLAFSLIFNKS